AHGGEHPDALLLADLHPTADEGGGRAVELHRFDQFAAAEDEAGGLRAAQPFAAAEDRQVGAAPGIIPEVGMRRNLRRAIDDHGDAPGMADLRRLLEGQLAAWNRAAD